jgi:tRNA (uracil-5-)-methyltransferase
VSATPFNHSQYQTQLTDKIEKLLRDFANFSLGEIDIFPSAIQHFRMRAEFRIWHQGDQLDYIMFNQEDKQKFVVTDFPIGSERINQLMPELLGACQQSAILKHKLYQVDFLTSQSGEALISLIYHKQLTDEWCTAAKKLKDELNVHLVGRSKGQRLVLDQDFITEHFTVDGREYSYQQVEASFTQPNAGVCEKMLNWATQHSKGFDGDLLELYCGNGNFTLPLSRNFNKVMATEISKTSVESALYNIEKNQIQNIQIARMSSEDFMQAMKGVREFFRLRHINLQDYQFSTLMLDPPRAGLDDETRRIAQEFDNIIYISCNPDTLYRDLLQLTQTHKIKHFAAFDQFPYTHHLETGVILQRQ